VICFEVLLKNWLAEGKEDKEFKNKMEIAMTLKCVTNTEGRWYNIWHSRDEYE
jgi:hypothetical protein